MANEQATYSTKKNANTDQYNHNLEEKPLTNRLTGIKIVNAAASRIEIAISLIFPPVDCTGNHSIPRDSATLH